MKNKQESSICKTKINASSLIYIEKQGFEVD